MSAIGLEAKLETLLAPILTPAVSAFVAPCLSIIIGAFAVVLGTRAIEGAINSLFGIWAELQNSKARRVEIEALVDGFLPELIRDNDSLKALIDTKFGELKLELDSSFSDLALAVSGRLDNFIGSLVAINEAYGKKLKYLNFSEFNEVMLSSKPIVI